MPFYLMPKIIIREIKNSYMWVQKCPVLACFG